jgi:RNA polymerase sigma factor (sigma-70 family)
VSPPDSDLIARVLIDDDRDAFGQLVSRYQSTVRNFLRHLTRHNAALADDLAQDTFVEAYRGIARFRADAPFSTWLLGIAYNHWRNARRRERNHVSFDGDGMAEASVPSCIAKTDLQHDLTDALRQLSADEQLALHLGYQQGLAHGEIARLVDWPLGTVKTHLARGKAKLRNLLAAWNPQI